jgi:hypothetical protein
MRAALSRPAQTSKAGTDTAVLPAERFGEPRNWPSLQEEEAEGRFFFVAPRCIRAWVAAANFTDLVGTRIRASVEMAGCRLPAASTIGNAPRN